MPDLVGDKMPRVYDQLQAVGLEARARGPADTDPYWGPNYVAIAQMPKAGAEVQPGSIIQILEASRGEISFYAAHPKVPNLIGLNADQVYRLFRPVLWTLREKTRFTSNGESVERVLAQRPAPGSQLRMGQSISIVVAVVDRGGGFPFVDGDSDVDIDFNINIDNSEPLFGHPLVLR